MQGKAFDYIFRKWELELLQYKSFSIENLIMKVDYSAII